MIFMCQCKFISCYKYITLLVGIDNGRGYACVEAKGIEKSLYLSPNGAVNQKPFPKFTD